MSSQVPDAGLRERNDFGPGEGQTPFKQDLGLIIHDRQMICTVKSGRMPAGFATHQLIKQMVSQKG